MRALISRMLPDQMRGYAKRIRQQVSRRAVILLYHRVIDTAADPQLLCVSPEHFSEHMQVLRKYAKTASLSRVSHDLKEGRLGKSQVVVTFDDGYADNFRNARPVLERYEVPATVFVTTGAIGSGQMYWWDELQNLLLRPGQLPEYLDLRPNGVSLEWRFAHAANYAQAEFVQYESWNLTQSSLPTERHQLYVTLHRLIRPLPHARRLEVMQTLRTWSGWTPPATKADAPMTEEEIRQLVAGNVVEVGAHTVTHPVLAALPPEEQEKELTGSRKSLEQILNRPVTTFAYPFGGIRDYTNTTVAAARRAGFACACSNYPGLIRSQTDRYQLPRYIVRDCNGDVFERELREWLLEW